ncbi:hypothetical protein NL676_019721 [Syzygium grande]|nr:hypothetical protein NL676_019721 [Syzygium grande]
MSRSNGTAKGGGLRGSKATVLPMLFESVENVVTVGIGLTQSNLTLAFNTGSELTWTQCKPCSSCYPQSDPIFDPSHSSSYANTPCTLPFCSDSGSDSILASLAKWLACLALPGTACQSSDKPQASTADISPIACPHRPVQRVGGTVLEIPLIVFSKAEAIIDFGTMITRLPPMAYNAMRTACRKEMASYKMAKSFELFDTCYDLRNTKSVVIPKIRFTFSGGMFMGLDHSGILYTC